MITLNDQWIPERGGDRRCRTVGEIIDYINEAGFLPYFKAGIDGWSVEEACDVPDGSWWSDDPAVDPWVWRGIIPETSDIAYGKFFAGKAGFVSREWFPVFASYRRDGYDFDSALEDGLVNNRQRMIMDALGDDIMFSVDLKRKAGFGGDDGIKGFDPALNRLQMQTYVVIRGFRQRVNRRGEAYGWSLGQLSTAEALYGPEHISSGYRYERREAFDMLMRQARKYCPGADEKALKKLLEIK